MDPTQSIPIKALGANMQHQQPIHPFPWSEPAPEAQAKEDSKKLPNEPILNFSVCLQTKGIMCKVYQTSAQNEPILRTDFGLRLLSSDLRPLSSGFTDSEEIMSFRPIPTTGVPHWLPSEPRPVPYTGAIVIVPIFKFPALPGYKDDAQNEVAARLQH